MTDLLPEEKPVDLLDRSDAEDWRDCPFRALTKHKARLAGKGYTNDAMRSGATVHDALSEGVGLFATEGDFDIDAVQHELLFAPPDIQADVLNACPKHALWTLKKWFEGHAPLDVLKYDGGKGKRSGQLAWDLQGVRLTTELDLLLSGNTPEELLDVDFKSGHAYYTSDDLTAFQFQFHAYLVFKNFPKCNYLHVRVFMTRMAAWTPTYTFRRVDADKTDTFEWQLLNIIQIRRKALSGGDAEAIPGEAKCANCPVVLDCFKAYAAGKGLAADPVTFARAVMLGGKAHDELFDLLREYVTAHGPIVGDDIKFGVPPTEAKKPTKAQYRFY